MSKFASFLIARLFTVNFLTTFMLFASEKLVKSTKVKWDDELHAIIKKALTD